MNQYRLAYPKENPYNMKKATIAALISTNGPTKALPQLTRMLRMRGLQVVVLCDGGEAECDAVSHACAAHVIGLAARAGSAAAIRAGTAYVREKYGKCVVVTVDAAGGHEIADILRVAGIARENPGKLILGARTFGRYRFPALVLRLAYRFFAKLDVRDMTTGLRAFDDSLFSFMSETPDDREEYEMNVLLRCAKEKIPIEEIDIKTAYPTGGTGTLFSAFRHYLRVYGNMIKFSLSSFIGFLTDYGMFNLLYALSFGMDDMRVRLAFANYVARAVSATVNYTINRRYVFKNRESVVRTAIQYFLLAALISVGNTYILTLLTDALRFHAQIAKLLTELLFFFASWVVQRFIIFRKKKKSADSA